MREKRVDAVVCAAVFLACMAIPAPQLGAAGVPSVRAAGTTAKGLSALGAVTPRRLEEPSYDAGDFYVYQGNDIRLERSQYRLGVRLRTGLSKDDSAAALQTLLPGATVELEGEPATLGIAIVRLAPPSTDGSAPQGSARDHMEKAVAALAASSDVELAVPVLVSPASGGTLLATDEIVVKLRSGVTTNDIEKRFGVTAVRSLWRASDEVVFRLSDAKAASSLEVANAVAASGLAVWAEPDFVQEHEKASVPDDPLFPQQWHLENTGQGGGTPGADAHLPAAWDLTTGDPGITIAVLDWGVEMTHEDLAPNLYTNPGEIAGNEIDDDGNGFVDDVHGWDFFGNDNDPSPTRSSESHASNVAGVAAARGGNGLGVSGACQQCHIMAVRLFSTDPYAYVPDSAVADGIRYAASLADVLNNSWTDSTPTSILQSAVQWAVTSGRGGKGAPVFFASGDAARSFGIWGWTIPAGTHRFRWTYRKDSSGSAGEDTAWLGMVQFPGGERVTFEEGMPAGWTTGGDAPWSISSDPSRADEGWCLTHSAKAGTIGDSQQTYIETVKTVPEGDLFFSASASSESNYYGHTMDYLSFDLDVDNDGTWQSEVVAYGLRSMRQDVAFPAAYPESIAVGAVTDFGCRASYSEYGPALSLVAPSSGGYSGITTTTMTGYGDPDNRNYTSHFRGTSAATPLAAGVVGLMLSRNPNLTERQVRQILQDTAEKVGPFPYESGRNDRYGWGRVDAGQSVAAVPLPPVISGFAPAAGAIGTVVTITGSGLSGATAVSFNGRSAEPTAVSASSITTVVPAGATSGPISVTTPGGTAASSDSFTVNSCTYAVVPASTGIAVGGGDGSVTVSAGLGCAWVATSNAPWIAVNSGSSGAGSGVVGYSVEANPGEPRTGTITIAGRTFTVEQSAGCTYAIAPGAVSVPAAGGPGTVNVTTGASCAWSAASSDAWLRITSGASGTGSGSVAFSVAGNSGPARAATIAVAGETFTVSQASGCGYVLNATHQSLPWSAGSSSFRVSAGAGCTWSPTANAGWITIDSGSTASGNGTVTYSVAENPGPMRLGTITVAGKTVTVTQGDATFVDIDAGLAAVTGGTVAWADFDGDGDLDVLVAGSDGSSYLTKIYRNDGAGVFTDIGANLTGLAACVAAWGDYDNDGDLDLVISGRDQYFRSVTILYRNDGRGQFTAVQTPFAPMVYGSLAWGDFDGDGDLDLLLAGYAGPGSIQIAKVYRNDGGGVFTDIGATLAQIGFGTAAWGDFDNDGDLDIVLTGGSGQGEAVSKIYRNDGGGVFTDIGAGIVGLSSSSAAWGDFDNDGDLDLLVSGYAVNGARVTRVYRNDGGVFTDVGAGLDGVAGRIVWGDLDNNGDLDIVLTGFADPGTEVAKVFRNDGGGVFTDTAADIGNLAGRADLGDFDNDGDLDIALANFSGTEPVTRIYRNDCAATNTVPAAPPGLSAGKWAGRATLSWGAATDGQTPSSGLTYNIRVGTTPGGVEVVSPLALPATGRRTVPRAGNAGQQTSALLTSLAPGTYYWSVQAIDASFAGSPFASEATFEVCSSSIDPPGQGFGIDGGTGTVSVSTGADCGWTAKSEASWIVIISGESDTGDGTVAFSVAADDGGVARSGTIMVAGRLFNVVQGNGAPEMLGVTKAGSGNGTVTSSPSGILCGSTCSGLFAFGELVTLSAGADPGSTFTGWSGERCTGIGTCQVTLDQARTVSATFAAGKAVGDTNGDGQVNVSDVFQLINYLFAGGPAPLGPPDCNGDGQVNVSDIFQLINYLFAGGPAPVG